MSPPPDPAGRPRVALVTSSFPLGEGEMSGVFVAHLAEHLARRVDLEVVAPAGERAAAPAVGGYRRFLFRYAPRRWQILAHRPGGIPAALAGPSPAAALLPPFLAALAGASFAAARRADLVHANWAAIAAFAAPFAGRPLLTTLRGSDVARAERSVLDRRVFLHAVRRSAAVVVVGESLRRRAAALAPTFAGRMVVIPNGIDEGFFAAAAARSGPDRPPRLVTVGSLVAGKGIDRILRAFATLPGDARLTVVGDGPLAGDLTALADRLGVGGRVCFTGAIPPVAVPERLAEADLFVFASDSEGRPNAVLEALAAGLAVVAPAIPAVCELVDRDTAALYPPGDTGALASRLSGLAADPERRRRLASAGHRRARELAPTWGAAADRYAELYHRILAGRGALTAELREPHDA